MENKWTYMGTTCSLIAISCSEMINKGLHYDDYLPLENKKNLRQKKLEGKTEDDTELLYMYSDETVSNEYEPAKAKFNFNIMGVKIDVDWKAYTDWLDEEI